MTNINQLLLKYKNAVRAFDATKPTLCNFETLPEYAALCQADNAIIERDRKLVEALRAVVATYSGGGHRCAVEVARKVLEEIGEG